MCAFIVHRIVYGLVCTSAQYIKTCTDHMHWIWMNIDEYKHTVPIASVCISVYVYSDSRNTNTIWWWRLCVILYGRCVHVNAGKCVSAKQRMIIHSSLQTHTHSHPSTETPIHGTVTVCQITTKIKATHTSIQSSLQSSKFWFTYSIQFINYSCFIYLYIQKFA